MSTAKSIICACSNNEKPVEKFIFISYFRRERGESSVLIKKADMSDLLALCALEERCFTSDKISRRSFRRFILSSSADLLVALSVDTAPCLLGYLLVLYRRNSTLARVYSLAVNPCVRGQGIAQKCLAEAEKQALQRHCECIRLEVNTQNLPAIHLYEKAGYQKQYIKLGYYEDGGDAISLLKTFGLKS